MGAGIPVVGIIIIPAYMNWLGDHAKQKPAGGFPWQCDILHRGVQRLSLWDWIANIHFANLQENIK